MTYDLDRAAGPAIRSIKRALRDAYEAGRAAGPELPPEPPEPVLPQVTPIPASDVHRSYGVCAHPTFNTTVYRHTSAWLERLASMNVHSFRGMYSDSLPSCRTATAEARRLDLKWLALVAPEDWSVTTTRLLSRLAHLRDNAADVVVAIEGVNEPNHQRNGGAPPPDWPARTVAVQKLIYEFVKSSPTLAHVRVVGPSLHAIAATEGHYRLLGQAGIGQYMDAAGLHRYTGGRPPGHLLDERLAWVAAYWGPMPSVVTETGYTDAMHRPSGHTPVPADIAATYAGVSVLEHFRRGCDSYRYELLNDPDPENNDIESNFGLFETAGLDPSTWQEKPEAAVVRDLMGLLADPLPHTPSPIGLAIEGLRPDLHHLVTSRSDGSVHLLLWRANASVYDITSKSRLAVEPWTVNVVDAQGSRLIPVAATVVVVELRR